MIYNWEPLNSRTTGWKTLAEVDKFVSENSDKYKIIKQGEHYMVVWVKDEEIACTYKDEISNEKSE